MNIFCFFKSFFKVGDYGDSLRSYIVSQNPKTTADVEILERQWLYKQKQHTGGKWL